MPRTSAANKQAESIVENEKLKNQAESIFSQSTALTETVAMPSRGLINGIPKEIVIRAIQRKDKKKMLLSETDDVLLSLLQYSIVSPADFNVYNLLPFESEYLLYRLRVLTYGSNYTFKRKCPYCGTVNDVEIDLNEIPIVEVPDNFKIVFDIPPLPVSGIQLKCKLLSEGERKSIAKRAKELEEATGNKSASIDSYWDSRIVAVNGNSKLAPVEITQILDELTDYDSEYFMAYYSKYEGNYGLQTKLKYECDNCHNAVSDDMPNIATFFRPKFTLPDFI